MTMVIFSSYDPSSSYRSRERKRHGREEKTKRSQITSHFRLFSLLGRFFPLILTFLNRWDISWRKGNTKSYLPSGIPRCRSCLYLCVGGCHIHSRKKNIDEAMMKCVAGSCRMLLLVVMTFARHGAFLVFVIFVLKRATNPSPGQKYCLGYPRSTQVRIKLSYLHRGMRKQKDYRRRIQKDKQWASSLEILSRHVEIVVSHGWWTSEWTKKQRNKQTKVMIFAGIFPSRDGSVRFFLILLYGRARIVHFNVCPVMKGTHSGYRKIQKREESFTIFSSFPTIACWIVQ